MVEGFNGICIIASIGIGAPGIELTTAIGTLIALPLKCTAIICGVLAGIGKFVSCKLKIKAKKHNEIYILAEPKLNTILNHILKAIEGGSIIETEFKMITDELQKYRSMKEDIRSKTVKTSRNSGEDEINEIEAFLKKEGQLLERYKVDGLSH